VRDRVVPIRDESGDIYRYAGLSSDITELKRAEEERVQLAVEREKVRLLREFVAEVTHDLKTPLSSIHLKLYQASKVDDPQKRAEVLDELGEQVDRIGGMVSDMLTLSRLESLNEFTMHRVNLNEIIGEVAQDRFDLANKKDIALLENLATEPLSVLADRDDLGRAIGNLIDNAIHYTPEGGRIEVESQVENAQAVVVVRDTGIGIAESDLANIFDRFFRGENGRKADPGGTGLGLAIVKRVVDAHYGRIDVTSALGKGTTFRIALPLVSNGTSARI
jgi:two-component system phosphate regulon sensor histidine kinase PhoR